MDKLNIESIRPLDKSDMLKMLLDFPGQIDDAARIGREFGPLEGDDFNKIVFSGLGGSAIGADLIRSYVRDECRIPIIVNRDYTLPAFVDEKTLLIISSYSGNTEETLSAYEKGRAKKANIVAITSNGALKKSAIKDGFPCISIPQGFPPRCALAYSSIPLIMLLSKSGIISDKMGQIEESSGVLSSLRDNKLSPGVSEGANIAKPLAESLSKKLAVIYAANRHFDVVATRWRGQLAENSKSLSSTHVFPEMNHNEIVGWDNPKDMMKDLSVVFLRDKDDHPRVKVRMDISRGIIEKRGAKASEVFSEGGGLLSRIFSLIYIGDFVSLYLAILNNTDPTPVDSVTYLKKELAKIK